MINGKSALINGKIRPYPHHETHEVSGSDKVELDASQIVTGVFPEDRIPHTLTSPITVPSIQLSDNEIKDSGGTVRINFSSGSYTDIFPRVASKYGNGYVAGGTGVDAYFYVGSLPYSSTSTYEKLLVMVWGGRWDWVGSGLDIYVISSRGAKKVFRSRLLGSTSHYEIKIYDNGSGYDVYVHVTGDWPNLVIRAFQMKTKYWEGSGFEEVKVVQKTPTGTDDTANWEFIDTIITFNDGSVKVGGVLQVGGNNIKDSGGNVRITLGDPVIIGGSIQIGGNMIKASDGTNQIAFDPVGGTITIYYDIDFRGQIFEANQIFFKYAGGDLLAAMYPSDVDFTADCVGSFSVNKLYAVAVVQTSSAENKEILGDFEADALSVITKLQLRKFRWKKSGEEDFGLVAEEVESVAPELVNRDSKGKLSLSINRLLFFTIRAIQQLTEKVNALEERINQLEAEVAQLREALNAQSGTSNSSPAT